jgi:hypothetical protein
VSEAATVSSQLASQSRTRGLKPWQPGQTGNPGGKPRRFAELSELSKANFSLAVKRLGELIASRDDELAFRAIQFTFLYLLGKPAESMTYLEATRARLQELAEVVIPPVQRVEALPQALPTEPAPSAHQESEPQVAPVVSTMTPPPPETPAATPVGGASLGFEMTPERAEFLDSLKPEKPVGLRCLHHSVRGQCDSAATDGKQWCAKHTAELFGALEGK